MSMIDVILSIIISKVEGSDLQFLVLGHYLYDGVQESISTLDVIPRKGGTRVNNISSDQQLRLHVRASAQIKPDVLFERCEDLIPDLSREHWSRFEVIEAVRSGGCFR